MQNIFQISVAHAGVISDAPKISSLLLNILNFLLSIIGISGIIGLVISGVMYLTAGGNEERMRSAKNMIIASVTGMVIALGSLMLTG
ncbi:MAG: hypothetical protein WCG73_00415 [Candidatus Moraniibacteriota bacterium]